jgi:hypothetical protein
VGQVGRTIGEFNWGDWKPGGGVGVQFTLAKSNHLNFRTDYAWGKGSSAWYVSLGEVF